MIDEFLKTFNFCKQKKTFQDALKVKNIKMLPGKRYEKNKI